MRRRAAHRATVAGEISLRASASPSTGPCGAIDNCCTSISKFTAIGFWTCVVTAFAVCSAAGAIFLLELMADQQQTVPAPEPTMQQIGNLLQQIVQEQAQQRTR